MVASTHQMFGLTVGLFGMAVCNSLQLIPKHFGELLIYFSLILIGSILPDIDHPKAKLGRYFFFFSYPIYWLFGHRTFTHSLAFVLIVALFSASVVQTFHFSYFYAFGLLLGISSHLIGDAMTNRGIPFFYPAKRMIRFPLHFKTGGWIEKVLAIALCVLNVFLIITYYTMGFITL